MITTHRLCIAVALKILITCAAQASEKSNTDEKRAVALMNDIKPGVPVVCPFLKIHGDDCHGVWGNLFGDTRPAALIGVEPPGSANAEKKSNAQLLLLVWDKEWTVVQRLGEFGPGHEERYEYEYAPWRIKQRQGTHEQILLGSMDLNVAADKLAWALDASTHRLKPTGWPKDAVPAISGDVIVFNRFQPGRGPTVKTIHRYGGSIGGEIISIREDYDQKHVPTVTLTLPATKEAPAMSWRIRAKARGYNPEHDVYELCRTSPADSNAPFVAHAEMVCVWDEEFGDLSAVRYLFHKLTGLGRAAYDGVWDEDNKRKLLMPKSAAISGVTEAVKLFGLTPKSN